MVLETANLELETSLTYSLPLVVGQGGLLEAFWKSPYDLESFAYRCTRYGNGQWRVGERRLFSTRYRDRFRDRLNVLRAMSDGGLSENCVDYGSRDFLENAIVSELKIWLTTDRTFVFDDSISLLDNLRYPLILEDRLSAEIELDDRFNNELLDVEDDTSDNNLGIRFVHRLSFYDRDVSERSVRVSLRSTLNEFHEISYALELECESPTDDKDDDDDDENERTVRHSRVLDAFRRHVLPLLREHWPQGLRVDSLSTPLPHQVLDDFDRQNLYELRTAESSVSRSRLLARLRASDAILIKHKYDGERAYAFYRGDDTFSVNGTIVRDRSTKSSDDSPLAMEKRDDNGAYSGLLVYQIEVLTSDDVDDVTYAFTEVVYALDHRRLFETNGGGALLRQIEHSEYRPSVEQNDPYLGYMLLSSRKDDSSENPWSLVSHSLTDAGALRRIDGFLRDVSRSYGSYVHPYESPLHSSFLSKKSCGGEIDDTSVIGKSGRLRISSCARMLSEAEGVIAVNSDENNPDRGGGVSIENFLSATNDSESSAEQGRGDWRTFSSLAKIFVTLRPIVSNLILLRTVEARETVGGSRRVILSKPFFPERSSMLSAYRTTSASFSANASKKTRESIDGYLLLRNNVSKRSVKDADCVYEKIKLRQTVELGVSWSKCSLSTRNDSTFADRLTRPFVASSSATIIDHRRRPDFSQSGDGGGSLWMLSKRYVASDAILRVIGIPPSSVGGGGGGCSLSLRVAEFEFVRAGCLRFVRWRDDKDVADGTTKALRIIFNRGDR